MPRHTSPDAGLAHRVQREAARISSQHRQLDDFHAVVTEALARGEVRAARTAFERFTEAVEAHVSLEEEFYFPALHGLAPEVASELATLANEHESLRSGMREIADCLKGESAAACASVLARWTGDMTAHERREETLLARAQAKMTA